MRREPVGNLMDGIWDFVQQTHNFIAIPGKIRSQHPTWQMAAEALSDGACREEGTDFFSYATGASRHFLDRNCGCVVVAGYADHPSARAH